MRRVLFKWGAAKVKEDDAGGQRRPLIEQRQSGFSTIEGHGSPNSKARLTESKGYMIGVEIVKH